jgi:transposase
MEHYAQLDYWAQIVRNFKDSERKEHDRENRDTEDLARFILDYVTWTNFRQYKLFQQRRGEEFEMLLARIEESEQDLEAAKRMIYDDEFWTATLELAE